MRVYPSLASLLSRVFASPPLLSSLARPCSDDTPFSWSSTALREKAGSSSRCSATHSHYFLIYIGRPHKGGTFNTLLCASNRDRARKHLSNYRRIVWNGQEGRTVAAACTGRRALISSAHAPRWTCSEKRRLNCRKLRAAVQGLMIGGFRLEIREVDGIVRVRDVTELL